MPKTKVICQGAEAIIIKSKNTIIKDRIPKSYRHPSLDKKLRKRRTKSETKLLTKAHALIPTPRVISSDNNSQITMEFISGKRLSDNLEKMKNWQSVCKQIGSNLALLHDSGIIHGDLTTSNMILTHQSKLYFIDFGLGFHSDRTEDKAVDLHLIKEALEARHHTIFEKAFSNVLEGYKTSKNYKKTTAQLEKVERRGRYKAQY